MIQHHFHFHFLPRKEIFDHNFITEALDKFFKTIPIGDMAPSIVTGEVACKSASFSIDNRPTLRLSIFHRISNNFFQFFLITSFFRLSFINCKSCVCNCDDLLWNNSSSQSSHIWFSYFPNFKFLKTSSQNISITLSQIQLSLHEHRGD